MTTVFSETLFSRGPLICQSHDAPKLKGGLVVLGGMMGHQAEITQ